MAKLELLADEAWTHNSEPKSRYHCFFGGILGDQADLGRLDTELRKIIGSSKVRAEVKWSNVQSERLPLFKDLVACVFNHIAKSDSIRYRQVFCDRAVVRVSDPHEPRRSDLDVQFLICYQFLKHAFGLIHLPRVAGEKTELFIRLDRHSSRKHAKRLTAFAESLPHIIDREDLEVKVRFVDSANVPIIQVCDLMMGAAGSHGNKMHLRRQTGQRGQTAVQKARYELAAYVYNNMRDLDSKERGSRAFNWFESTGQSGDVANRYRHKLRIWKFLPERYRIDEGWNNKNLASDGSFIKSQLTLEVRSAGKNYNAS